MNSIPPVSERTVEELFDGAEANIVDAAEAARRDPSDDGAWDTLEEWAAKSQAPDAVSDLYRTAIRAGREQHLVERALRFHEEWYPEDATELLSVLRAGLRIDALADASFQRLTVLYTSRERWRDLLDVYDARIDASTDERVRAQLLGEALDAARNFAGDANAEIDYLGRLLALDTSDFGRRTELESALERAGRSDELIASLRERLASASPSDAAAISLRIARIEASEPERVGAAVVALRDLVVDGAPNRADAVAMLETISADESVDPTIRRQAIRLLRDVRIADGDGAATLAAIEAEIALATPEESTALSVEAGATALKLGDLEASARHYAAAFEARPEDVDVRSKLRQVHERAGRLDAYAAMLESVAERSRDATAAMLRAELGSLRATALGDTEGAIEAYAQLLERASSPEEIRRLARTLGDLHLGAGRKAEALALLEREASATEEPSQRRTVLGEAAALALDIGEVDRALAAYETRLALNPKDREALDATIAILDRESRHASLVAALRRRVELARAPVDARRDLVTVAKIEAGPLGDPDASIATWSDVASRFGEDAEVVDALAELFAATGRSEALADLLERAEAREGSHLVSVRSRLGDVYLERLERPEPAVAAYERALDAAPKDEAARAGLALASEVPSVARRAIESLTKSYAATDEWEPELALVERRLALATSVDERVAIRRRAAQLAESHAGAEARAFEHLASAFVESPHNVAIEQDLARLAPAADPNEVVATFERAAAATNDDPPHRARLFDVASRAAEKLGDHRRAFESARSAFASRPRDEQLASRLIGLATDPESMAQTRDSLLAAVDESATTAMIERLAAVQRRLRDPGLVTTLVRIAERKPRDLDALAEAVSIALESGDSTRAESIAESAWERASSAMRSRNEPTGARKASEVASFALELVLAGLERRGEPARASLLATEAARLAKGNDRIALFRRALALAVAGHANDADVAEIRREILRLDPDDAQTSAELGAMLERDGRLAELLELRLGELARAKDADRRLALRLIIVGLVDRIERATSRVDVLRANLDEVPGHAPTVETLVELLVRARRADELADLLAEQAKRIGPPASAAMWKRVARIAMHELGDEDRARRAYEALAEIEPSVEALDALATIAEKKNDVLASVRWLERRLAIEDGDGFVATSLRLARAQLAQGRKDRAAEVLEQAFARRPDDASLRDSLIDIYSSTNAHAQLARVAGIAAGVETDVAKQLELAREAARIEFHVLGRVAEAIPMLERASELAPDDKSLRMDLADAYRRAGALDSAKSILEKLIEEFGRRRTPERAQVHAELGRVLEQTGDFDGAITQLEQATQIAVTSAPMLASLGRLAVRAGQVDRAEKTYRTLLVLVRRRSENDPVDVGVSEVLYELHSLALAKDERAKADELLESALEAATGSDAEAVHLVDSLLAQKDAKTALRAIEARVTARTGPKDASIVLAHARVLEANGNGDATLDVLLTSLDELATDPEVRSAARDAARARGASARYAESLGRAIGRLRRGDDESRVAALVLEQASCLEVDVGAAADAASLYRSVAAGTDEAAARIARSGLARSLRLAGDLAGERDALVAVRADAAGSADERLEALYRIAELDIDVPERRSDAIASLRNAVDEDGRAGRAARMLRSVAEAGALDADGWHAYEGFARDARDPDVLVDFLLCRAERPGASMPEIKEAVDRALAAGQGARARALLVALAENASTFSYDDAKTVFRALADIDAADGKLASSLRYRARTAEFSGDDEARTIRFEVAAAASPDDVDPELAIAMYRELLTTDPDSAVVLAELLALGVRRNDAAIVDDVADRIEPASVEPAERNRMRREIARFRSSTPDGTVSAIELLRRAVADDPLDVDSAKELDALYEREGYDSERAGLLEARIDALLSEGPSEELADSALRAAELHARVDRPVAASVLDRALDVMPEDRRLVLARIELLSSEDGDTMPIELRERLIATEPLDAVPLLALRVHADWEARGDEEGCMRALERASERLGDDDVVVPRLDALLRSRREDERLVRLLGRRLDVATDPLKRREIAREAAQILRDELRDPGRAASVLSKLLDGPFDLATFEELVACLVAAERRDDAISVIGRALDAVGSNEELRTTLLSLRSNLRRQNGDLAFALADLEAVPEAYRDRTIAPMVSLLTALSESGRESGDAGIERTASLRLAALHRATGDAIAARDVLAAYVDRNSTDVEAIEQLIDIQREIEDDVGLRVSAELLVARTTGERRVDAALLYADVAERTSRLERAREILEHVRVEENDDRRIVDRLRGIYVAMGEHREVAQMLVAESRTTEDEGRRFECLVEAGRILLEAARDPEAAIEPLVAARDLRPDDVHVVVYLVDALLMAERLPEAGQLLETSIAAQPKRRTPELSQLQHRMGRYARAIGDRNVEMQWMVAALECDKNNVECAAELSYTAMELGDHETALNALRAITLARSEGSLSRAMAYLLQAKIAHARGETRRALLWARKAKEVDPGLGEVDDFLRELGDHP